MFGIVTAEDFHAKSKRDYLRLAASRADADLSMNAILSNYHLHEWTWSLVLKTRRPIDLDGTIIRNMDEWVKWLEANCPYFAVLRDLANGSKHCIPAVYSTDRVEGFGQGPYGVGSYGVPYLLLDLGNDLDAGSRWLVGSEIVREASEFWDGFFEKHVRSDTAS